MVQTALATLGENSTFHGAGVSISLEAWMQALKCLTDCLLAIHSLTLLISF